MLVNRPNRISSSSGTWTTATIIRQIASPTRPLSLSVGASRPDLPPPPPAVLAASRPRPCRDPPAPPPPAAPRRPPRTASPLSAQDVLDRLILQGELGVLRAPVKVGRLA